MIGLSEASSSLSPLSDTSCSKFWIASALWKLYPNDYKLDQIDRLLVNKSVLDALRSGEDPQRIAGDWRLQLEAFMQRRAAYLEY